MDFTILGSAAAEAWPALHCNCDVCAEAKRRGGKDIRTRTAYALGDAIRIDLGPDTYHQCLATGNTLVHLRHLLFTHSHGDHCYANELFWRRPGFSQLASDEPLRVYGNDHVRQVLVRSGLNFEATKIEFVPAEPFEALTLDEGIEAIPLLADHADDEEALNYVLRCGDSAIVVGNDTGWWPEQTWDFLGELTLHVVVMDCTGGPLDYRSGHMGIPAVKDVKAELLQRSCLAPNCRFIANHFSHNGGWLHEQLEASLAEAEIEAGYDGMAFEAPEP